MQEARLPSWHPAYIPLHEEVDYDEVKKAWVTINGAHINIGEDEDGGGRKGIAARVAADTKGSGGATVDVTGHSPKKGYAVSPYKNTETKISADKFGETDVDQFMQKNQALLGKVDHYVGAWYNTADNHIYLDVSVVKNRAAAAVKVARSANQLAIYDIGKGAEIAAKDYGNYKKNYEEDIFQSQDGISKIDSGNKEIDSNKEVKKKLILKSILQLENLLNQITFEKSGDGTWITVNGRHILIGADGTSNSGGGGKSNVSPTTHTGNQDGKINGLSSDEVHSAILEAAKNNPHVKDPEMLADKLTAKYELAVREKATIDGIADDVASKLPNATVMHGQLKGFDSGTFKPDRAVEKFRQDGDIKDLSRNAILVNSVEDAATARSMLAERGVVVDEAKDYFAHPTYMGYRGMNGNHVDGEAIGEVQVHVPEVLYYKEPASVTQPAMGAKLFNQIKAKADSAGLVAGQGHALYEETRQVENQAIASGRFTINKVGAKEYVWTPQEAVRISNLVAQSNKSYETALSLAAERASR